MENLIKEYEACDAVLTARITELRKKLKTGKLQTKERQSLEVRIDLLSTERTEIRRDIKDMTAHLKIGGVV